jgi:phosphatidylglycerol:prolipoprotein diacylglycerol transferase
VHPKLGDVAGLDFYSLGTCLVLSAPACLLVMWPLLRRRGANPAAALDLSLLALIAYGLGARLLYAAMTGGSLTAPLDGLPGLWGGQIAFAALAGGYFLMGRGPVRDTLDALAVGWAAQTVVVKIGCFLGGCCHGAPTDVPWAVVFPPESACRFPGVPLHPTQVYDGAAALVIGAGLLAAFLRGRSRGSLVLWFGLLASAAKVVSEAYRGDARPGSDSLAYSRIAEAAAVGICGFLLAAPAPWRRLLDRLERRPAPPAGPRPAASRLRVFLVDAACAAAALAVAAVLPWKLPVYVAAILILQAIAARRSLRLVDAAGGRPGTARVAARAVVQGLAAFTLLGLLRPLLDRDGRSLGDALAETWPSRAL